MLKPINIHCNLPHINFDGSRVNRSFMHTTLVFAVCFVSLGVKSKLRVCISPISFKSTEGQKTLVFSVSCDQFCLETTLPPLPALKQKRSNSKAQKDAQGKPKVAIRMLMATFVLSVLYPVHSAGWFILL